MPGGAPVRLLPMFRPLDWLVVALSLTFLIVGRSLSTSGETRTATQDPVLQIPTIPRVSAQVLPFEPTGMAAVPAGIRRERTLEFGYIRLDTPTHN